MRGKDIRGGEERRGATEEREGDECPMGFSSSLAYVPLHVLNTTVGPALLHTTVHQIPGNMNLWQLVQLKLIQADFSFFLQHKYLKTIPLFAEWQK